MDAEHSTQSPAAASTTPPVSPGWTSRRDMLFFQRPLARRVPLHPRVPVRDNPAR
ncbi:MAG: hypothetical protein K0Q76_3799 [Panacagrimonas sp.]|jgi:hypothetical protein|nr:hypothetical protein [Panacagrimonas sp.]MCC2658691.1 hypothetical protein [Panacagrimonas sp.]